MILLQQGHRAIVASDLTRAGERDAAVGTNWKAAILVRFGIFRMDFAWAATEEPRGVMPSDSGGTSSIS